MDIDIISICLILDQRLHCDPWGQVVFLQGQKCGVTLIFCERKWVTNWEKKIQKIPVGNIHFLTIFWEVWHASFEKRYGFLRRFSNENVRSWPDSAAKPVSKIRSSWSSSFKITNCSNEHLVHVVEKYSCTRCSLRNLGGGPDLWGVAVPSQFVTGHCDGKMRWNPVNTAEKRIFTTVLSHWVYIR